jgi:hypothetical protein
MSELQRAASNIQGSGYDVLTGIVEGRKVIKMFKETARSFRRVVTNTKSFTRGDILDAWASGRYGYRTLAFDIRDLNDAINNWDHKRTIWTERSGYTLRDSDSWTGRIYNWTTMEVYGEYSSYTTHSIRGAVAASIKPARFSASALRTGWEIIPYSFVLDWVISVGDALGTAQLLAAAEATTSSIGVQSVTTQTARTWNVFSKSGYSDGGSSSFTAEGRAEHVSRTPTTLSIKPTLRGRLIRPEQILDLTSFVKMERSRIR